jgi:hypothetical protein
MEIAANRANIKRSMMRDGTNEIATLYTYPTDVRIPGTTSKNYEVRATWTTNGINIRLDDSGLGLFDLPDYLDTDSLATNTFVSGGHVGFRRLYTANQNHNIEYDNFRLHVLDFDVPPPPPVDPGPDPEPDPDPVPDKVSIQKLHVGEIRLRE